MVKKKRVTIYLLLLIGVLTLSGCEQLIDSVKYTLTVDVVGEGEVNFHGSHSFLPGTIVELNLSATEPWEFYAWTGEDGKEVIEDAEVYLVRMDRDMEITAFFAKDFYEFVMEEYFFMGSGGEAFDLTDNAPYPPGFEIELQAKPATDEDAFLHWSISQGDPRDYFQDYEAELTRYTIPDYKVTVTPYFTRRTKPVEPGNFHFNMDDFGLRIEGRVGLTEHYWDLGEVGLGEDLSFFFHARNLPDRFRVYYGLWEDLELIFCSGWVSLNPSTYENLAMYPEGLLLHDWHERVELSYRITFRGNPGGGYESIIRKEAGTDVLLIQVEGRDEGTIWDYVVDKN